MSLPPAILQALAQHPLAMLTERDVAALLQCSVRLLQQWREDGTAPPEWMRMGERLVRYPAQRLAAWLNTGGVNDKDSASLTEPAVPWGADVARDGAGLDEVPLRGGRRKKPALESFAQFLEAGAYDDEWLFVCRGKSGRPIDFVASLAEERDDDEDVMWLTVADYADALTRAVAMEKALSQEGALRAMLPKGRKFPRTLF